MKIPKVSFLQEVKIFSAIACILFPVALYSTPIEPDGSALFSYVNHSRLANDLNGVRIYPIPYDDETGQSGAAAYTPGQFAGGTITLSAVQ